MDSALSLLTSYLPQHEGLLPKWLLFVSVISVGNSIQAYLTTAYSAQVYLGPVNSSKPATAYDPAPNSPVTPLSSRTFGTWTLIQSLVRLYAAYYIDIAPIYQMAFLTYLVAWGHFVSEWQVFGTARLGKGLLGPLVVSTASLVWMFVQWGFYVK
ncbi:Ergosterol biosynthetic protein 28 [Lachnellula cervina]|uniref:Ergosterol biosynthetic protein 28 n=1 Tax=Lachnellula cervina TaxID=1316786 RepID=A0A7D8YQD3_9HELO|nr:Ergosterol biosynthetic protein 28 [Lachnellula cervina]